MKVMIVEATAEELRANRRIVDSICDAMVDIIDAVVRVPGDCDDEEEDDEQAND